MKEMINYIIEANAALLLFLAIYWLFLRKETNFQFLRFFILIAIFVSAVFPLVHLNQPTAIPTIGKVIPEYWLPEIAIGGEPGALQHSVTNAAYDVWQYVGLFYLAGVSFFFLWLMIQLGYVLIMLQNATAYKMNSFKIIESEEDKPSFSFFNLIYIGRSHELTPTEKEHIIRHERVHADKLHSMDILIVTILGILFWFNPFIRIYKKILIQLHEFEADARAVEDSDVNMYCSLLARVALQSHFPIASHFNESLTLKRIEMMRTIKRKIKNWKIVAASASVILCFFIVSCQDQIIEEVSNSTITQTSDYPEEVKNFMNKYQKDHPNAKLTYMEGEASEVDKFINTEQVSSRVIFNYNSYYKNKQGIQKKGVLITDAAEYAEVLKTDDKVFLVVEKAPEYTGGFEAMKEFYTKNIKYTEGKSGVVFVSMTINETGSVSDATIVKGISAIADAEALRVTSLLPGFMPGEQNGKKVKVRYVMPVHFGQATNNKEEVVEIPVSRMEIEYQITRSGNEITISGQVTSKGQNTKPLPGVNLVIAGSTRGTTTDAQGKFSIKTEKTGRLVASFIGFEPEVINF